MKLSVLILSLVLGACATYKGSLVKPDGTALSVETRSFTTSGTVLLTFERDAKGEFTNLRFQRADTALSAETVGAILGAIPSMVGGAK